MLNCKFHPTHDEEWTDIQKCQRFCILNVISFWNVHADIFGNVYYAGKGTVLSYPDSPQLYLLGQS